MLSPSELILNADGSIYHLHLLPTDIADSIITVGDPERVAEVSDRFDTVEIKKAKREFHTHTGTLNGKRLTVISTGIGTDNIDIVLNELDALANIDLTTRRAREKCKRLDFIRIGTSGAVQSDIPIDSFVLSEYALGFDGLLQFYDSDHIRFQDMEQAFAIPSGTLRQNASVGKGGGPAAGESVVEGNSMTESFRPYAVDFDASLADQLVSNRIRFGVTATCTGFYGPQGRRLRLATANEDFIRDLSSSEFKNRKVTNLEMETAGIYGLAKLLGHRAISISCILANRITGEFSTRPKEATGELIDYCLEKICSS